MLWGIPYLFIKIAVDGGMTPPVLAWGRVTLAAVVLLALAARSGSLRQLRGRWRWLIAYGVGEISIPFPLIATGEQHVASSLAAILLAAVGYAAGPMILKRHFADLDPRAAMGASLAVAAVVLAPVAAIDAPARTPSSGALAAVVVLGLLCTATAFALMAVLIAEI